MEFLTELGGPATFVVILLYIIFDFLKKRKSNCNGTESYVKISRDVKAILEKVDDLYQWHDVRDRDGTPIWYVKRSLEDVIIHLGENIEKEGRLLEKLVDGIKRVEEAIKNTE